MSRIILAFVMLIGYVGSAQTTGSNRVKIAEGQYAAVGVGDSGKPQLIPINSWSLYRDSGETYQVTVATPDDSHSKLRRRSIELQLDGRFRLTESSVKLVADAKTLLQLRCTFGSAELRCAAEDYDSKTSQARKSAGAVQIAPPYSLISDPVGATIDLAWFPALLVSQAVRQPQAVTVVAVLVLEDNEDQNVIAFKNDPTEAASIKYLGEETITIVNRTVRAHKFTWKDGVAWTSNKGLLLRYQFEEGEIRLLALKQFSDWEPQLK